MLKEQIKILAVWAGLAVASILTWFLIGLLIYGY